MEPDQKCDGGIKSAMEAEVNTVVGSKYAWIRMVQVPRYAGNSFRPGGTNGANAHLPVEYLGRQVQLLPTHHYLVMDGMGL